jgi:hypothetical protein
MNEELKPSVLALKNEFPTQNDNHNVNSEKFRSIFMALDRFINSKTITTENIYALNQEIHKIVNPDPVSAIRPPIPRQTGMDVVMEIRPMVLD